MNAKEILSARMKGMDLMTERKGMMRALLLCTMDQEGHKAGSLGATWLLRRLSCPETTSRKDLWRPALTISVKQEAEGVALWRIFLCRDHRVVSTTDAKRYFWGRNSRRPFLSLLHYRQKLTCPLLAVEVLTAIRSRGGSNMFRWQS